MGSWFLEPTCFLHLLLEVIYLVRILTFHQQIIIFIRLTEESVSESMKDLTVANAMWLRMIPYLKVIFKN